MFAQQCPTYGTVRMRKIAVISSSRADAGLLYGLLQGLNQHPAIDLQLFVTGMHLSKDHGLTYQEFAQYQLAITAKIPMNLSDNSPLGNAQALAQGIIGFSQSFAQHQPDLVVVLGDRFEILSAVESAMMLSIPIAHLHGGELTLGAMDDAIRHAISKMSHIHFTATEAYRQRLIQMGEQPQQVYNVGATAIENIIKTPLLSKEKLQTRLDIIIKPSFFLITWHPETIHSKNTSVLSGLKELLAALENFPQHQVIFTKANTDSGGEEINQYLQEIVIKTPHYHLFSALGLQSYLSMIKLSSAVLGNSSSSLIEVAALRKGSVNIGHRQDGRYKPASVIDCHSKKESIIQSINQACSAQHLKLCQSITLDYGNGHSSEQIVEILSQIDLVNIQYKKFYNLPLHSVKH